MLFCLLDVRLGQETGTRPQNINGLEVGIGLKGALCFLVRAPMLHPPRAHV